MFYSQFSSWINLFLLSSYLVGKSTALKCYICGGEDKESFPCSEFQAWDERYNKECEESSKSCRITRGVNDKMILSRSCENIEVDECKIANLIEYCYCSKSLCNKISQTDAKEEPDETEDDISEDSMEGSGIKNVEHKVATQKTATFNKSSVTEKASVNLDKAIESNIIPHSSSCIILRSNLYLSASVLSLCFMITKQY